MNPQFFPWPRPAVGYARLQVRVARCQRNDLVRKRVMGAVASTVEPPDRALRA